MKYSYNWLKELSGTKKSPQQLAELLMTHAFEVESIEKFQHGLDGVVVGKVMTLVKHPNADKLRVAEIEIKKNDIRQIVCGAPNVAVGQKVAVALPGVKLSGMEIKAVEIRGVESRGMICSAKELNLGDDHTGILVLSSDTPIGVSFVEYFGLDDSLMEVKILPDRGSDALSYQGLAREIAALDGVSPRFLSERSKPIKASSSNRASQVVIDDKRGCLRYVGIAFENIAVGESPLWLKVRLLLSGLRPINNIVDATNYLMLLTGQPMHAFDMDQLTGSVTIRRAKKDERLMLLTGETKTLSPEDLVIADEKGPVALAGVMGGAASSVTEKTKNIFLEIATFDATVIRRTKTRYNLLTDAGYRFERGLDPNLPGVAAQEAASLVHSLTGGIMLGMRDIYPKVAKEVKIKLSLLRVENVLGREISIVEAGKYLTLLGLTVKKSANKKILDVIVPTRRPDLCDEWDLIEEIGRMYGYEKIVSVAPLLPLLPTDENMEKNFERRAKEYLVHSGFDEIMTYSFYGEKEVRGAFLPLVSHLELANPLSPDQKFLRMTLLPLLLQKAKENLRSFNAFNFFEWGSVFVKGKAGVPIEFKSLGLLTMLQEKNIKGEAFSLMKGRVLAFFESLHIDQGKISWGLPKMFPDIPVLGMLHPTRSAVFAYDGQPFGVIGEIHPRTLKAFDLPPRVAVAGFVAEELRKLQKKEILFTPLQKFPFAVRDISLTFPRKVTVSEVEQLLREAGAPLLQKFELFDIYDHGEEKSLAFHLFFGAPDRTLESLEMDTAFDRIVALAKERFEARLRD
ncbi:MAG: phenylalanine--tRNA ligase subunit beta [Candidatus Moranbacteria bacterium]|nr:phenylalanine--tRNA ligase subunit beta [Candidatus Moranbacteria bacterium]